MPRKVWINIGTGDGAMHFVINKTVSFNVAERTISDGKTQHVLSNPACRLLLVLLENNNRLMTREELLQKVWGDFGLTPSSNSLNNNVSILRKIFAEFGIHDVLKTVPKQGFELGLNDLEFNEKSRDYMVMQAISQPDNEPRVNKITLIKWSGLLFMFIGLAIALYLSFFDEQEDVTLYKKVNQCSIYYHSNITISRVERFFTEGQGANLLEKCSRPAYIFYDDSKVHEKTDLLEIFVAKCSVNSKGDFNECKNFVSTKAG